MTRTHLPGRTATILLLTSVLGLALTSCGHDARDAGKTGKASKPPSVRVAEAEVGDLSRRIELAGTVEPTRLARLASPAEGPVVRLAVREGDATQPGQAVVVIGRDSEDLARLEAEREDLRNAEDELERVGRLVEQGAVPGELLDDARADVEQARAALAAGEQSAADHRVLAPWAGVVASVLVQEGNFVAPRTPLVEVFDPGSLVVRIGLPEATSLSVEVGDEAEVTFDARPGEVYTARVERLFPSLDRTLRTRTAELVVQDAPALAPGMFARVELPVERVAGAVILPLTAIVTTPAGEQLVYGVEGSTAVAHTVELGIEDGGRVQVIAGVEPGQRVIVAGHAKVRDGAPVTVAQGKAEGNGPGSDPGAAAPGKGTSR